MRPTAYGWKVIDAIRAVNAGALTTAARAA
jgi:hypothetical protein